MGKAAAHCVASKGATAVTLFARRKEALEEAKQEIEGKFPAVKVLIVAGDAASAEDNQRAVDETVKSFGGLHGAFLNAGVYKGGKSLTESTDEDIDILLNV